MMTTIEIYQKALDGLAVDRDYLNARCLKRYQKPGYEELEEKLKNLDEKMKWLRNVIKAMEGVM